MGEEVTRAFMDIVKIVIQADVGFFFAALITYVVGTLSIENFRVLILLSSLMFIVLSGIYISMARQIERMEAD